MPGTVARPFAPKPLWILGRRQSSSFSGWSGERREKTGQTKGKMNKFRDKTTATLLIAIFIISIFAIAMPVSADDLKKPEVIVKAVGQFIADLDDGPEPTIGH